MRTLPHNIERFLIQRPYLSCVILFALLLPVFTLNLLDGVDAGFFESWQHESDLLVLNGMDIRSGNSSLPWGLSGADGPRIQQLGFQGYFYLLLSFATGTGVGLKFAAAALFALTIAAFVVVLARLTNVLFGSIFLVTMGGSPWIVTASQSVYWSLWTWILPAIMAAVYILASQRRSRGAALIGLFISFAIRFACGYEFVTSNILLAAVLPIVSAVFLKNRLDRAIWGRAIKKSFTIMGVGLAAFIVVLLIHAQLRGDGNLGAGLQDILIEDVLRRTYGNPADYDAVYRASLSVSPLVVVGRYALLWKTDFLVIGYPPLFAVTLGKFAFPLLLASTTALVTWQFATRRPAAWRNFALYCSTLSIPLSWFILAKGHSWIHGHINYLLWYQLFAAAMIYIVIDSTVKWFRNRPVKVDPPHSKVTAREDVL